jgi:hypothetical protein
MPSSARSMVALLDGGLKADQESIRAAMLEREGVSPEAEPVNDQSVQPVPEADLNPSLLTPEQVLKFATSPEGRQLATVLDGWFEQAMSARKPYEKQWYLNKSFYDGKQYVEWNTQQGKLTPTPIRDRHTPRIIINKIRPIIRTEISKLISQKPTATVMPQSNDDEDRYAAQGAEQVWESLYNRRDFERTLRSAVFWMTLTGTAYIKTYWDPNQYDADSDVYGDVKWAALSPFNVLVPDLVEQDVQEQPWVMCVYYKPIEYLQQMFGSALPKGERVVSDAGSQQFMSTTLLGVPGSEDAKSKNALVIEAYIKPGFTNYLPRGGFVTLVNGKIVQASLNGLPYKHGQYPIAKLDHIPTGRFYAESTIVDLIPLQIEYNRTASQIIEAKNKTTKPQVVYEEGSVTPQYITTEPGQWIPVRPNAARPQPLPVQELPSYVVQHNERMQLNFEDISGQHEVSRGSAPPGVGAATAIAYLQERDDSYIATTIASMETAIQTTARQSLSLCATYWDVPRLIKATGEDGAFEAVMLKNSDIERGLDLRIEAGSALPDSKSAKIANVTDFMKMGFIPALEGLELLDMPVLKKFINANSVDKRAAEQENIMFRKLDPALAREAQALFQAFNMQQAMVAMQSTAPGMPGALGINAPIPPMPGEQQAPQPSQGQPSAPTGPEQPTLDGMEAPAGPSTPFAGEPVAAPAPGLAPQEPPMAIPINEWDDDEQHLLTHELAQKSPSFRLWPEEVKAEFQRHVDAHKNRILARAQGLLPPSTRQLLMLSAAGGGLGMGTAEEAGMGGEGGAPDGREGAPGMSNADFGGGQ